MVKHDSLYRLYKHSSPHVASLHCHTVKVALFLQILLVDVSKLAAAEQEGDARNVRMGGILRLCVLCSVFFVNRLSIGLTSSWTWTQGLCSEYTRSFACDLKASLTGSTKKELDDEICSRMSRKFQLDLDCAVISSETVREGLTCCALLRLKQFYMIKLHCAPFKRSREQSGDVLGQPGQTQRLISRGSANGRGLNCDVGSAATSLESPKAHLTGDTRLQLARNHVVNGFDASPIWEYIPIH